MKPGRGKYVAAAVVAAGIAILAAAVFIFRDRLLEEWHFRMGTLDSGGAPVWLRYHRVQQPRFDFVRIRYTSFRSRGRSGFWQTDYPDADNNLSARLRQITSLETGSKVLELTDRGLSRHPFIYLSTAGSASFSEEEADSLRKYLLEGGFLMVDDFWGEAEWESFSAQLKKVFPHRKALELPLEHGIFHCVFDLKEKPQVCSINMALQGRQQGITWEVPDGKEVHYRGILDDRGRLMVLLCHNTDLADGWERTGADAFYTEEFSRKRAFPMGINIIYYALTQ